MGDIDETINEAKDKAQGAIADGKKTSRNAWFWVALAVGLIVGFGTGKLF